MRPGRTLVPHHTQPAVSILGSQTTLLTRKGQAERECGGGIIPRKITPCAEKRILLMEISWHLLYIDPLSFIWGMIT